MIAVLAESQLPTTEIGLFGLVILGFFGMFVKNSHATDRHMNRLVELNEASLKNHSADLAKVMTTHEQVSKGIVKGLDGVKESVHVLGSKLEKNNDRLKQLIVHVKGPLDDDDSNG